MSADARARETAEAHVRLADILTTDDIAAARRELAHLNLISTLMEKVSRVSSWGVRTAYAPVAAALAFLLVLVLPVHGEGVTQWTATDWGRAGALALFGVAFLYFGLKAVQLTKAAMRLLKRYTEYDLLLGERARLATTPEGDGAPRRTAAVEHALDAARAELSGRDTRDELAAIAAIVDAHRTCADIADGGKHASVADPLAVAVARLRLAQFDAQREAIDAQLAPAGDAGDPHAPRAVARRRRLLGRADALADKRQRLARATA